MKSWRSLFTYETTTLTFCQTRNLVVQRASVWRNIWSSFFSARSANSLVQGGVWLGQRRESFNYQRRREEAKTIRISPGFRHQQYEDSRSRSCFYTLIAQCAGCTRQGDSIRKCRRQWSFRCRMDEGRLRFVVRPGWCCFCWFSARDKSNKSSSGYLNDHIYYLTQNIDSGRPASTESSSADDWPDDASIEIGENSALPMPFVWACY